VTEELTGSRRSSRSTLRGSPFPPIAECGFLSDCEVSALIAASGTVEWMCLPRMDSPSAFGAILDRSAGWFRLGPADVTGPAGRRYLPGTMVLETTWATPTGWAVVRDVLLVGPWRHDSRRSSTHTRVLSDHSAARVLLRTVRCLNGSIDFLLECEPAFDYGRQQGVWRYTGSGYSEAEVLGEYSAETVQTVAACMAAGMTIEQVAELQLAFPTFTEAVCMAAQKICRTLGTGRFPQVWSYLGADD